MRLTRRTAVQCLVGSSLHGQASPPVGDLANVFEIRDVARRKLAADVYEKIAGTDRRALERITFRPRLMVNVSKLDLTSELFGEKLFAPILVGPISHLQDYHPEGETAMALGAAAAKTLMIISGRASRKLPEITKAGETTFWFQVYPDPDIAVTITAAREAVSAGCTAVCLTVGNTNIDWATIARLRQSAKVPLLLKGIMSPEEAQLALSRGIDGVIVSNHGATNTSGFADPTEVLPSIVEAVGAKVPVLIDGSFRRGTDILKALALGAKAVLLGRPPVWGLAAYGAEGVQAVLEMLQTELARNMALCGKPDLKSVDRTLVRIHRR